MDDHTYYRTVYTEYMTDMNDSQGFYVTPTRDGSVIRAAIRPIENRSSDVYLRAERAVKFAVEEHNKKEGKERFKFVKIVNATFEPTVIGMFYITMEAEEDGETSHYQVKVWETRTNGFKVKIPIKRAPYALNPSDKVGSNVCRVGIEIDKSMPWMNECYLYYKCFYLSRSALLGLEIDRDGHTGSLWFKNREEVKHILAEYDGKIMPRTNKIYIFDFQT